MLLEFRVSNKVGWVQVANFGEDKNCVPYDINLIIWSYAACLIVSQGGIFEDPDKGTSIKKVPYVVSTQELEFILNLHVTYVFLGNRYYFPMCGGFLCLDFSVNISLYFTNNVLVYWYQACFIVIDGFRTSISSSTSLGIIP